MNNKYKNNDSKHRQKKNRKSEIGKPYFKTRYKGGKLKKKN